MTKTIIGKYTIYAEKYDHKTITIVENMETDHWVIGSILSIGLAFRSSTSYKSVNINYDSDFTPLVSTLYFDTNLGQFYIKTTSGDQYIQNEKYIEMMKEFNSSKKEDE